MLIRSSSYTAVSLNGVDYLLPFGQSIVDQRSAYHLSGSGRQLWDRLAQAPSQMALLDGLIRDGEVTPAERETVQKEIAEWISDLEKKGLLKDVPGTESSLRIPAAVSENDFVIKEPFCAGLSIAGLNIVMEGSPDYVSDDFHPFLTKLSDTDRIDQRITVTLASPFPHPGGVVLLENENICVIDEGSAWRILYPSFSVLRESRVSKDGSRAIVHLRGHDSEKKEHLQYELFHACRLFFLIRARLSGCYALHSASIIYRDRAWLFSAPSGTGKSTHVSHWVQHGWANVLNGDLNLIAPAKGGLSPYEVRGIPWCGTSETATTKTVPLGGIILLRRSADSDKVTSLQPDEKQLKTMQRLITPSWTEEQLKDCLHFTGALTEKIPVCTLACTAFSSSADVMKEAIDTWLDRLMEHRSCK